MPNNKGALTEPREEKSNVKKGSGKSETAPKPKLPAPPNLSGKFKFIRPAVEAPCINLQCNMVKHTKPMRKMFIEIYDCTANLPVFNGKYINKHNVDCNGNRKEKPSVPTAFREN